jgi:hypothetical protein
MFSLYTIDRDPFLRLILYRKRDISLWNTLNLDGHELSSSTLISITISNYYISINLPSPVLYIIIVSFDKGKVFSLNKVNTNPRDIIHFTFLKLNYTLT